MKTATSSRTTAPYYCFSTATSTSKLAPGFAPFPTYMRESPHHVFMFAYIYTATHIQVYFFQMLCFLRLISV